MDNIGYDIELGYNKSFGEFDLSFNGNVSYVENEVTHLGIGVKRVNDFGMMLKLEYAQTDYDQVSWVTANDTKGMADLDSSVVSVSIGKEF